MTGPARKKRRPRWSKADDAKLRELVAANLTNVAIAHAMDTNTVTVSVKHRKLGIPDLKRSVFIPPEETRTVGELAAAAGISRSTMQARLRKVGYSRALDPPGQPHVVWSAEDLRQLKERAGTVPIAELARTLHRTPFAVGAQAARFGISLRLCQATRLTTQELPADTVRAFRALAAERGLTVPALLAGIVRVCLDGAPCMDNVLADATKAATRR